VFALAQPVVSYTDPWPTPLAERLRRTRQGKHRVAYLYDTLDSGTFRYRVYNMIQALTERPEIAATYFTGDELPALASALPDLDVLVVGRYRYTNELSQLICRARDYGKRVFFDTDDLVFDLDYVPLMAATLDLDLLHPDLWDPWFAMVGRMGAALKLCEAALTTNEHLAERIRCFTAKRVTVIPNFINREQYALSQQLYAQKQASGFARDGRVHLGYFSGSATHNKDLEVAAGAIARLLGNNPDVVLRVVGFMELKGPLRELGARIERIEFQDFLNLQRHVAEVELNLVPLQDNEFTNCKSELKYFEAGIVGTLTIASPVFSYRQSMKDGATGFLARDYEWDSKLAAALQRLGDYRALAEAAQRDCEQRYLWHRHTDLIAETLFSSPMSAG